MNTTEIKRAEATTAAQTLPARFLPLSYKPGAATINTADGWNFAVVNPLFDGNLRTTAANILTAAPELLSALKDLAGWGLCHTSPLDANSPHKLLIAAVEAIAKAEGRAE